MGAVGSCLYVCGCSCDGSVAPAGGASCSDASVGLLLGFLSIDTTALPLSGTLTTLDYSASLEHNRTQADLCVLSALICMFVDAPAMAPGQTHKMHFGFEGLEMTFYSLLHRPETFLSFVCFFFFLQTNNKMRVHVTGRVSAKLQAQPC